MLRLFQRMTAEGAKAIPTEGFCDGDDGVVWFSERLDCWEEKGRHLLDVALDMTDEEMATFAVEMIADEVFDDTTGTLSKSPTKALSSGSPGTRSPL